jgi:hypothetical protein
MGTEELPVGTTSVDQALDSRALQMRGASRAAGQERRARD